MRSERRQRARRIFEQVVEAPEAARTSILDRVCGDDEALKAAVERLLRADADAGGFLREPLVRVASERPFLPPDRVGPYRLREKIGEGGMGAVYRAVRDDEVFQREVAVKLLAHGAVGEETRRRLRAERQILAALDHPWIAQIFDGGTTDEGLPYLVMELVEGEPIDRYCDREELSIRQRLALFCKVCAAVHCSHQNLVVHCDLKPSNILVTGAGDPKLLDFGIAKLLRQDAADDRDEPTTVGSRPLTPEYASPEQIRGEALSTVSDVYSLGVLLHKLLIGRRPDTPGGPSWGIRDEDDVLAPSALVAQDAPGVARQLRGDLDAIVLKSLRINPKARFGSVQQLAEDLGRHLDGFPVLARRGSWRYRARKFLRRHRAPVAAAVTGLAVLMVFALSMATMAGRLSRERAKLQEVVDFFRGFFEHAGPLVAEGRNLTLREAVDQNAEMIEAGLEDQPAVKVEIVTVLGDIYRELGQPAQALRWSERALALQGQLVGQDSEAYALGLVQVGAALRELGRYDEAEVKTRAGVAWLQAQSDTEPVKLIRARNHWVSLLCFEGRYDEADDDSAEVLRWAEEKLDDDALETLVATANRGLILRQLGHTADAERLYQRALALHRQTFGATHPYVATLLLNLSSIQRDRGDLALAARTLDAANHQYLEMFGPVHYGRIRPLVGLAKLAAQQQHIDDALALYRQAIEVAMASEASPSFVLRPTVEVADLLLASGRCREGEELLRDSLEHSRPHADRYWRYAEIEGLLGECLVQQAKHVEARAFLERSYGRLSAQADVDPDTLRRARERLVAFYEAMGEEPRQQASAVQVRITRRIPATEP